MLVSQAEDQWKRCFDPLKKTGMEKLFFSGLIFFFLVENQSMTLAHVVGVFSTPGRNLKNIAQLARSAINGRKKKKFWRQKLEN